MALTKLKTSGIADGAVTADGLATGAVTASDIADETITVAKISGNAAASAGTFLKKDGTWASAGGDNTPAWGMKPSTYKASMASQTWQSVNFDTEMWNVGGGTIDTTNYTYTIASGEGGKYHVGVWVYGGSNAGVSTLYQFNLRLRRTPSGGSAATIAEYTWDIRNAGATIIQSGGDRVLDLTAGDLLQVEGYCHITTGAAQGIFQDSILGSQFYGYKLIGV